jgi:ADP-glucose pyrophosphorylase
VTRGFFRKKVTQFEHKIAQNCAKLNKRLFTIRIIYENIYIFDKEWLKFITSLDEIWQIVYTKNCFENKIIAQMANFLPIWSRRQSLSPGRNGVDVDAALIIN